MSDQKSLREKVQAALGSTEEPFALLTRLRVKDVAGGDRLEEAMKTVVRESRKEAGNITYHVNRDAADPTVFYLYDRWRDVEATEVHEEADYFKAGVAVLREVIAGPPEATILAIVAEDQA